MRTRVCWWSGCGVALILLWGLTVCPIPAAPSDFKAASSRESPAKETETVPVEQDDTESSVQLLVPDFLQEREEAEFGYFMYLIFAEQTQASYNKRLAAAKAFVCQHWSLSQALGLGVKKSELVVFYAPVKKSTNKHRLVRSKSAGSLLKEYHYRGANFLRRQLRVRSPSSEERFDFTMGIIGSPVPLMTSMAEVDTDTVQILKLDKKSPHQIAMTIREFRNGMTTGGEREESRAGETDADLTAGMQNPFSLVRSMVFPARPEPGDAEEGCQ